MLILFLACVQPDSGKDPSDGAVDDPSIDDTAAPDDTAGADDTAGPDDTASENDLLCEGVAQTLALADAVTTSPYATWLLPDLDGDGGAEISFERGSDRTIAIVSGADPTGEPLAAWPLHDYTAQACVGLAEAGDLDGDGTSELVLWQCDDDGARWTAEVWSLAAPDAPIATVRLAVRDYLIPVPNTRALPDLDDDGVPDVMFSGGLGTWLYSGATLRGDVDERHAHLTIEGVGVLSPTALFDLDGDLVDDVVLGVAADLASETADLRVLLSGDARPGGTLDATSLPRIAAFAPANPVQIVVGHTDEDLFPDLAVGSWERPISTVRLWRGADLLAGHAGPGLDAVAPHTTLEGPSSEYFAAHLALVGDGSCLPGLAVSAHFAGTVYRFDNALLLTGGTYDTADAAEALTGEGDWFGYTLGGGADLDANGQMDLVASGRDGHPVLLLNPGSE